MRTGFVDDIASEFREDWHERQKPADGRKLWLVLGMALAAGQPVVAQTMISGNSMAYKSTGSSSSNAWILDRDGYLGTYITLASPGSVTIKVNAEGTASGGVSPHMAVAIADSVAGFTVAGGANDYTQSFALPAGTFFVRTQFDNDVAVTSRQVRINSITVTGASVANSATSANSLAASDTYVANYRKGNVTLNLAGLGLAPGSPVSVSLKKHSFAWGTVAPESNGAVNSYLGAGGTSQQTNYQTRLLQNFNALGTENAGKWNDTESTRNSPTMAGVDTILNFAESHGLTTRLHTLAYDLDNNDPSWVNTLRSKAVSSAAAKTDLRNAISSRIDYYMTPARAAKVDSLDVLNESYQSECCRGNSSYMSLYGASGVASVVNELQEQLGTAETKLYVNEYNALIYPNGNAAGYFPHVEKLLAAGAQIDGIGTQHYPWALTMHSPSDILKAMQTYNITGLPQTLTELGAYTDNGLTSSQAATILGDVMRLEFGNPNSNGVYLWGFHRENGGSNLFAPGLALYDVNTSNWNIWTITAAGKVWQDKLGIADWDGNAANAWTTQTTLNLTPDGTVAFDGYWGDYQITAGGETYDLTLSKGTYSYTIGGLAGDFKRDGRVDAADYVLWRENPASYGGAAGYRDWRANYGKSYVVATTVPEPNTIAIASLIVLVGSVLRRKLA